MRLTMAEFDREVHYQLSMYFIRRMLDEDMISVEEFILLEAQKNEKFHPFIGSLLSMKFLLCVPKYMALSFDVLHRKVIGGLTKKGRRRRVLLHQRPQQVK